MRFQIQDVLTELSVYSLCSLLLFLFYMELKSNLALTAAPLALISAGIFTSIKVGKVIYNRIRKKPKMHLLNEEYDLFI